MGIENVQSYAKADAAETHGITYPPENTATEANSHPMDSQEAHKKHGRFLSWFEQERERQLENRREMALDHDFYDGLQWNWEDAQVLIERGQAPLVYNLAKPTVDWIIGSERRLRVDWRVLPRSDTGVESAGIKTKVLKYLSDVNKTPFQRSRAFEDSVKGGIGWVEDGVRMNPGEEAIYARYESWKHIWFDSFANELDQADWRYTFRIKTLDTDVASAFFPDRANAIQRASYGQRIDRADEDEDFWYLGEQYSRARDRLFTSVGSTRRVWYSDMNVAGARRERVRMFECWYRDPMKLKVIEGGPMHGALYDPKHQGVASALKSGVCGLVDQVMMRMRCAIFTEGAMIYDGESPYRHNRFPFTPMWCYRRFRDNMPYGTIRNLRDPQEDFNKRASKVLFLLSVNRVVADDDAVEDHEEAREEAAKPNAYIKKKRGREFLIQNDASLAEAHFKIGQMNATMIQKIGGVNDDNMGRQTNAQSGEAIKARQSEGALQTLGIFDNKRLAMQLQGEKTLSLAEQYMSEPRVIRVTGYRGELAWQKINQPEFDPATGEVRFLNDITADMADFIVDEQDYHSSLREALFEEMMSLVQKLPPEVGLKFLDLVVDLVDIPGKSVLVNRIRKMTGMTSPEDEQNPSPEKKKELAAAAQQQQEQQQMARESAILALAEQAAKVQLMLAQADAARAKAMKDSGGEQAPDPEADELRKEIDALTGELQGRRDEILSDMQKHQQSVEADHQQNAVAVDSEERKHAATLAAQQQQHAATLQAGTERHAKELAAKERMAELDRRTQAVTAKAEAKAKAKKQAK